MILGFVGLGVTRFSYTLQLLHKDKIIHISNVYFKSDLLRYESVLDLNS